MMRPILHPFIIRHPQLFPHTHATPLALPPLLPFRRRCLGSVARSLFTVYACYSSSPLKTERVGQYDTEGAGSLSSQVNLLKIGPHMSCNVNAVVDSVTVELCHFPRDFVPLC